MVLVAVVLGVGEHQGRGERGVAHQRSCENEICL